MTDRDKIALAEAFRRAADLVGVVNLASGTYGDGPRARLLDRMLEDIDRLRSVIVEARDLARPSACDQLLRVVRDDPSRGGRP